MLALTDPPPFPITRQRAAADCRVFHRLHGNTATREELDADLAEAANRLRETEGLSCEDIGKALGIDKNKAHAFIDPEWGKQYHESMRARYHARKARR